MFWDEPPGHEPNGTMVDLRERWQADGPTRRIAMAMIDAAMIEHPHVDPDDIKVFVGLALPGKQYGVWTLGQPVEPAPGYFLAINHDQHRAGRDLADRAAGEQLAGRAGTTSWALLKRGEYCAVFEGMYGNEESAP